MKCSCVLPVHLLKCFENGNVKKKTFTSHALLPMRSDAARRYEKYEIGPLQKKIYNMKHSRC
jgi:hypothetical protein